MAQRGHAPDCPGCEWDACGFQPEDLRYVGKQPPHRREVLPPAPKSNALAWILSGTGALVFALCVAAAIPALQGATTELGLLAGALGVTALAWVHHRTSHGSGRRCPWCRQDAIEAHHERFVAWKADQIAAYNANPLWPCPGCGDVYCNFPTHRTQKSRPLTTRRQ